MIRSIDLIGIQDIMRIEFKGLISDIRKQLIIKSLELRIAKLIEVISHA